MREQLRGARFCVIALSTLMSGFSAGAMADGFVVDKVYHPYVNPIERELEYRSIFVESDDAAVDGIQIHQFAFAHAFAERFRGEFYLIGANRHGDNLSLEGFEAELLWQLTEQGEYWADWGLLFELEKERGKDIQELSSAVIAEKEFGQWAGTVNLWLIYEWGGDVNNEWETELKAQLRYRYARFFEPAIELYSGQDFKGLGPVAVGSARMGEGRKLLWELGIIFGVDSDSPDQIYRVMLEYEF
ncbi:MAG: hypothetical protein AMJ66_11395 [Betaproteobacteria bacterium SG8_40]|nr:MAG: hypothetical protein AMJ66_11395 [Betaproteobacteria bacterium SG8_40]